MTAIRPLGHRVRRGRMTVALRETSLAYLSRNFAYRPKPGRPVPYRRWLDGTAGAQLRELMHGCDDPMLDLRALVTALRAQQHPQRHLRQWSLVPYLQWREAFLCRP